MVKGQKKALEVQQIKNVRKGRNPSGGSSRCLHWWLGNSNCCVWKSKKIHTPKLPKIPKKHQEDWEFALKSGVWEGCRGRRHSNFSGVIQVIWPKDCENAWERLLRSQAMPTPPPTTGPEIFESKIRSRIYKAKQCQRYHSSKLSATSNSPISDIHFENVHDFAKTVSGQ